MPNKQLTREQQDRKNARLREARAAKAAGTYVPRVFTAWRDKPDMSQIQPRDQSSRPVQLPAGNPKLLPVAAAAASGQAACSGMGPHLFDSDSPPAVREQGKQVCKGCDIRTECATSGAGEKFMIWGGVDAAEREAEAC